MSSSKPYVEHTPCNASSLLQKHLSQAIPAISNSHQLQQRTFMHPRQGRRMATGLSKDFNSLHPEMEQDTGTRPTTAFILTHLSRAFFNLDTCPIYCVVMSLQKSHLLKSAEQSLSPHFAASICFAFAFSIHHTKIKVLTNKPQFSIIFTKPRFLL